MKRQLIFWFLAIVVTLITAYYQRTTGPTYALKGKTELSGRVIPCILERSHGGQDDHLVLISVPDSTIRGKVTYRRYQSDEPFQSVEMTHEDGKLMARLPHQPPAGQLEYYLTLDDGQNSVVVPADRTVVMRFKGDVPNAVLIPHILLIFVSMLLSTRAGLEALSKSGRTKSLVLWTTLTLLAGGLILGPLVQKYAFGSYWTGVPFGWDLTDNKTLIAFCGWVAVMIRQRRNPNPRYWVLAAALIMLVVFLIPHSVMGSRLDYATGQVTTE
ncbi:MAG: hypothetical protein PHR28_02950 [candidate division Zixibacteria bacterium]|nr:hypothetical protein [candidate division Zixibacteria bacterium]